MSEAVEKTDTAETLLPFRPSDTLQGAFIHGMHGLRGPVYRPVAGTAAPKLARVTCGEGYIVTPPELAAYEKAPGAILRPRVAIWMQDGGLSQVPQRAILDQLDRDDVAQMRALGAAAFRDIGAKSEDWIQDLIGTPGSAGQTRTIRRSIKKGRDLWVALAAWPWWPVHDAVADGQEFHEWLDGKMATPWWQLERVQETLVTWTRLSPDLR